MNGSFYKNFRNLSVLSAFSMLLCKIKKLSQKTNFSYIVSSFGTAHNGLCFFRGEAEEKGRWQQNGEVVAWQMKQKNTR
jgi:hypothetical protein